MQRSPMVESFFRADRAFPNLGLRSMLGTAEKLGDPRIVRTFSMPLWRTCCADAGSSCAVASSVCRARCYFWKMTEGRENVAQRAERNWLIAQRDDFPRRFAAAVIRSHVECVRVHDFGDFFSVAYIEAIARVVRICREAHFWCYTRAWRVSELIEPFTKMAAEPNFSLLLSADRETGLPPNIPNTRVAWLADDDGAAPSVPVHVVFRATGERTADGDDTPLIRLGGSPVCPIENGLYSETEMDAYARTRKRKIGPQDCVACGFCLFKEERSRTLEAGDACPAETAV